MSTHYKLIKTKFNGKIIDKKYINEIFKFSFDMTFNKIGEHREYRSGGTKRRKNTEKFCNTFQGKLAELSLKNLLNDYNIESSEIDWSIKKLGEWDDYDLKVNSKIINIKSIKNFSEFLLLEKKRLL